ncbi:hypothetical protein BDV93DRAFT_572900 [Ceratobasidium sp. AG-I]|nr:hypothetical protein BDV93DRAFT_572900 [Ceratobasidium sp. AG-I]
MRHQDAGKERRLLRFQQGTIEADECSREERDSVVSAFKAVQTGPKGKQKANTSRQVELRVWSSHQLASIHKVNVLRGTRMDDNISENTQRTRRNGHSKDCRRGSPEHEDGNNHSPLAESTNSYGVLSEDEMTRLLFGIHVDGNDGPRWSACQIGKRKGSSPYLLCTYREANAIATEIIPTKNDRGSNYVHQGWSKSAMSTVTLWIESRIANSNHFEGLNDELYITKRITLHRLSVHITLEALSPVPEFEIGVTDALTRSTKLQKFQALNEIFQFWGDVIALDEPLPQEFDLGTSLSITDRQANFEHIYNRDDRFIIAPLSEQGKAYGAIDYRLGFAIFSTIFGYEWYAACGGSTRATRPCTRAWINHVPPHGLS